MEFISQQPPMLLALLGSIGLFNLIGLTIALVEELRGNHIGHWS